MVGRWAVLVMLATAACHKTEDAPRSLDQLCLDMYRDYDVPELLTEDVIELEDFLLGEGRTERAMEGYLLSDPSETELADVEHPPDRDLSLLIGAAVGGMSTFPPVDHGDATLEVDQMWNDPSTYNRYDRTIVNGDADTFGGRRGRVDTSNDIEKDGAFGVTVPYILMKDYQWITGSEGRDVMVARSWLPERGCSDSGRNCLEQSFSLEVYYPDPQDAQATIRLTVSWIDLVTEADSILTEEARVDLLIAGVLDIYEATDEHLAGE